MIVIMYKNSIRLTVKTLLEIKDIKSLSLGGPLVSHLIVRIESENTDIQFIESRW